MVAIKVDLQKAYDRLNWNFLEDNLNEIGLLNKLIPTIMACVSLCYTKVLWNGQPSKSFTFRRGVRQGDPISPYFFVLCIERLAHYINFVVKLIYGN